jgi:hypothetical protein
MTTREEIEKRLGDIETLLKIAWQTHALLRNEKRPMTEIDLNGPHALQQLLAGWRAMLEHTNKLRDTFSSEVKCALLADEIERRLWEAVKS